MEEKSLVPVERVESRILLIRGQKVILDVDLAMLYGVSTGTFNQAVKRNRQRFPEDFMFQLTQEEKDEVITNCDNLKKLRYSAWLPYAFTEHGAVMAANVLNSKRAIEASVLVVRTFIKLREMLSTHKELAQKLVELEQMLMTHDRAICSLFDAIREMMNPPAPKGKRIGFLTDPR
jgi:hypothetical protein